MKELTPTQALDIIKQVAQAHVDTIQGHNAVAKAIEVLEGAITTEGAKSK